MNDVVCVEILESEQDLARVRAYDVLGQAAELFQQRVDRAARHVLEEDIQHLQRAARCARVSEWERASGQV